MTDAAHTLNRSWDQRQRSQPSWYWETSVKENQEKTSRVLGTRHQEVKTAKSNYDRQVR